MEFRAKQIAPPKEWGTFEDLCHSLFKRVWKDALAQKNGRRGQKQHGVDVFGSPEGSKGIYQGVQCKGKDANYGSKPDWPEVLEEIGKAENFSPALAHWIFATTAPVDAALQKSAREISKQRRANGLFTVDVLGWEEIQALLADAPEIVAQFYPEHADHLPEAIAALRALPELETTLADLIERLSAQTLPMPVGAKRGAAVWEKVAFESDRGLGPALLGYPLGPSDAAACPELPEVGSALAQLRIAYSVRLVGEPGAGKSIGAYQAAMTLHAEGFDVVRLLDPQADGVALQPQALGHRRVYLIDDAHLLKPQTLDRLENQAGAHRLVLSTHNAVERVNHRGTITLDAKRAVKAIADALRADRPNTLAAARQADKNIGEHLMEEDLDRRLDLAERASALPWQFCFVLGGGWHRARQVADAARAAEADLALASVAIRQLVSRDARASPEEVKALAALADIDASFVDRGLQWLLAERIMISIADCRTPHQRFATVVLMRVLEGTDAHGRSAIAAMIEGATIDRQFPMAGVRVLIHELRFFRNGNLNWARLLSQSGVYAAIIRCWETEGLERNFAALALTDLWDFAEGGATAVVGPQVKTLSNWLSHPDDGAYGFGHLLNSLAQNDRILSKRAVAAANATAIADAYSNATPETAYGVADLLSSVAYVEVETVNERIRALLDREKLLALSQHKGFEEDAFVFAKFCASVVWLDEALALDMAEAFVPTAQKLLANDPINGFDQLSHDLLATVLRVFDVLGVYVGKFSPSRRQSSIARSVCAKVDPKRVAIDLSAVRPRQFQPASFFMHFLHQTAPRKYDAVLRQLDWDKIGAAIGDGWANMRHETEVLLGTLHSQSATRHPVQQLIAEHLDRIEHFPPRMMLIAPNVGIAHLTKGGCLRLAQYNHVSFEMGGIALAILADSRPDLVEQAVAPFTAEIARAISAYNSNFTGPAEGFVRVVIEHAPRAWREVLDKINPAEAEDNLAACLRQDKDHRCTAAALIESAIAAEGPIGDMARRLRRQFPKASTSNGGSPRFSRKRRRSKRNRKD